MIRPETLTFKQFRALAAVAEHGSITAAAERLGLTPPAVHTQLRSLEENLGTEVLDRTDSRGPTLTPEGQLVLQTQQDLEATIARCLRDLESLKAGKSGHLRLGVVSTGKYFAPFLVAELLRAFPKVDLSLSVGNRTEIIEALRRKSIDLAIMGRPPREPAVASTVIGEHPHILIASPGHHLATGGHVPASALLDETFIAREQGSGTRILMTRYLDRIGDGRPYTLIEMDSNETIKQAVIAGLGIAMISEHTVVEELRSGRLVRLEAEMLPIRRQWYLIHRADRRITPVFKTVHDHIAGLKGSFLPHT